ncbi:glycosyltransferase [Paenibacillus thalictri]|nr:glycosyltransferase [Paenibacillus thalictri]
MSHAKIIVGIEFNSRSRIDNKYSIGLTQEWIDYRMSIFMKFTFQSLKKQTNPHFTALIQYADDSVNQIRKALEKYEPLPSHIQFIPRSHFHEFICHHINGYEYFYFVRLDCDDTYHKSLIQQLSDYQPKKTTCALINQSGYLYDFTRNRVVPVYFPSPPFYTLIYKTQDYLKEQKLFAGGHGAVIKLNHEILSKSGNRNYMIVVHKRNTLNQNLLRGRRFEEDPAKVAKILDQYI